MRLAKEALVATGYFKASEVGDDIAPRIHEYAEQAHSLVGEQLVRAIRVASVPTPDSVNSLVTFSDIRNRWENDYQHVPRSVVISDVGWLLACVTETAKK